MRNPMHWAEEMEKRPHLFQESWERFRGYGVIGLPFSSGHVLAFRRMTSSSIGPPFTSIWHRDPGGAWTMMVNEDPGVTCPRYFGRGVDRLVHTPIELSWEGPMRLSLRVPDERLDWGVRLSSDVLTGTISRVGRSFPGRFRKTPWVLRTLGGIGGRLLRLGDLSLVGRSPNGQRYVAFPRLIWRVRASAAVLDGEEVGPIGSLPEQALLGEFRIPNRGIFAFGEMGFEGVGPLHHSASATR